MRDVPAIDLQTRDDVMKLIPDTDIVCHNGLRVFVKKITCAMGGDMCIEGIAWSYSADHKYNLFYGEIVFWGPAGISRNLKEYLNRQFVGRRTTP